MAHDGFLSDPHAWMPWLASGVGLAGIGLAWFFHLANRKAADDLKSALVANPLTRWLPQALERKWYFDEIYHALLRAPLWAGGHLMYLFDRYLIDAVLVDGTARLPRLVGKAAR